MKNIKINKSTVLSIFFSLVFLAIISINSCKNNPDTKEETATTKETNKDSEKAGGNKVSLTEIQYRNAGIEIGKITRKQIGRTIKVNGTLDVPPQNHVTISALMGGFVKSTDLLQGMHVKKGQVLVVMQHPDYIQLQQDYLESKSQFEFLQAEYKRQEELSKENVNAQKTLQQSKSNFESMRAKVQGLKAKLAMLNINTSQLEKGRIQQTVSITSPINGFVTQVNVNIGTYVNPADVMFKIVDPEHLHAELIVFEKDITKIKTGQKVRLILSGETEERTATVYLIGKEISPERTIRIHCHLDKEDHHLFPNMYIKALIETNSHQVPALPDDAIVNFDGKNYIFIFSGKTKNENNSEFEMVEIGTGDSEFGFTEVILPENFDADKNNVVIKGAHHLLAKMKNTEEE